MCSLAQGGEAQAQALYGQMLLDGHEVARDDTAALAWFTRAAAQHHLAALNMVGRCYDLGWGTAPDKVRAAQCYRVAATRGLAEAQYNLATLLALGEGVAEDREAALGLLEQAAAQDFAKALNFIGSFAEDGWAGPVDLARAADCYARAAAGGDFRGCFNHARLLAGDGRTDEALGWIVRAGALGNPRFVGQVERWLVASGNPRLAGEGVAALRRGAEGGC